MLMKKRGQAAMEFLMTYGWAILAAIIVVGVLWYIIGDPGNLAGDKFALSPPLTAEAKQLVAGAVANSISLEIRNGVGETMNVREISIAGCQTRDLTAAPVAHPNGNVTTYIFDCLPDLVAGDRFSGEIEVIYRSGSSSLDQISTGTVAGKVP